MTPPTSRDAAHRAATPTATIGSVTPDPTIEEVAAIAAAVEVSWPRAVALVPQHEPSRWRFSGRWWSKPMPSRRDRP